jgi:hypothetical protein
MVRNQPTRIVWHVSSMLFIAVSCLPLVDVSHGTPHLHALSGSGVQCTEKAGTFGKDRCLVALRDFSSGSRLFCEDPYAFAASMAEDSTAERSHHTLRMPSKPEKLIRCKGCQFARYASAEEQRHAWPVHREECSLIARCINHGHMPSPILLILARILARKRREREKRRLEGEEEGSGDAYEHVLALNDHYGRWPDEPMAEFAQVCA